MARRATALALAFFCALSAFAWPVNNAAAADEIYGRVNADNVKVRKTASTSADWWFKLPKDWTSQILDTTTKDGITWYKVQTNGPTQGSRTYIGYIHGDFFAQLTAEDQAQWLQDKKPQPGIGVVVVTPTPTATPEGMTPSPTPEGMTPAPADQRPTPIADPSSLGRINKGGVNFRKVPKGQVIRKLDNGTIVELLEIPQYLTEDYWFKIRQNGDTGYIQGQLITILTKEEAESYLGQATPTPAGVVTATPAPDSVYGYVKLQDEGINLRETPGGKILGRIDGKPVMAYLKAPVQSGGVTWYYVKLNNRGGYVHGGYVKLTDAAGNTIPPVVTPTPGPAQTPVPDTIVGYIKLIDDGINLRETPAGKVLGRIDGKPVIAYLKEPVAKSGVFWFYIKYNGLSGYVHSHYVMVTDAQGNTLPPSAIITPTPAPTGSGGESAFGYILLTTDKVNLRQTPNGGSLCRVSLGQILPMTDNAKISGAYTWYPVQAVTGQKGYVRGDMASMCDKNGTIFTPTPAPSVTPGDAKGYVIVTKGPANLRKSIGGATIASVEKNVVCALVSAPVKSGSYTWYPVEVSGTKGFLRSDVAYQLADFQVEAYLRGEAIPTPTPTPTPTPGPSKYLITTVDKVNLRTYASKDAKAPYNVSLGTVFPFTSTTTAGGVQWYKITYDSTTLWVQGNCVKVMNTAEYEAWLAGQPTPTPTPSPTPLPNPEDLSDMAETNTTNVIVRATGSSSGKQVTKIYEKGVIFTLTGGKNESDGYTWYAVKLKSGATGYIRGDLIRIYTKDEKKEYEDAQNPSGGGEGLPEATYQTLRKGSTGDAVKALQTKLKEKGYYNGSINGTYGTDTVTAVTAFQKAMGLTADGIAGPNTQHKLFGTVPVGSNDPELTNTIYPVEKIDWYTGGINTIFARGMNVKVTDVKSGITFWVHRWAGGSHADVEPLTAADTRRMCRIYGVNSSAEITSSKYYQRRPLWVTIGTRTFAASMYGVPHNYPDGDTIANNDFKGQFCIHFTNSKTHTGNKVDAAHTEAIQYAYDHAPQRK